MPRPLDWRSLWPAALVVLAVVNVALIQDVVQEGLPADWDIYIEAGRDAWSGRPIYDDSLAYPFTYSPLLAYLFGAIAPIGYAGWWVLHLLAAGALPFPLSLIALASFPFWWDAMAGNVVIFQVLLGAWAMRGQAWAIGGTFLLAVLVPRPVLLPLLAWLLWRHPAWRLPFVVIAVTLLAASFATGQGVEWLATAVGRASDMQHPFNLGPSAYIGLAWIPIGLALAAWLVRRGNVGLACLAASPYLLPYYLLFGLLGGSHRRDLTWWR